MLLTFTLNFLKKSPVWDIVLRRFYKGKIIGIVLWEFLMDHTHSLGHSWSDHGRRVYCPVDQSDSLWSRDVSASSRSESPDQEREGRRDTLWQELWMSRNHEEVEAKWAETMRRSTRRVEGEVVGWLGRNDRSGNFYWVAIISTVEGQWGNLVKKSAHL